MTKRKRLGQVTQHDNPHWDPLLKHGRAFEYCGEDKYRKVEISMQMMERVLASDRLRPCHAWADFDDGCDGE